MKNAIFVMLAAGFSLPVMASTVSVDYFSDDDRTIRYIDVQRGSPITFVVKNACKNFNIAHRGYRPANQDRVEKEIDNGYRCENYCAGDVQKTSEVVHSSQFDGYEFSVSAPEGITRIVKRKDGDDVDLGAFCKAAKENANDAENTVRNATGDDFVDGYEIRAVERQEYLVVVDQSPWEVDFSVGPVVSWLTSPVYYLDDANTITRNEQAEDDVELIVAGLAHVSNRNCRWNVFGRWEYDCSNLALTGGVGTSTGSTLDYFIGGSKKFGPAMFTVGAHWGTIYRLPNEYVVGNTSSDVTVVTESGMDERTDVAFFLSLTYTFGAGANESTFAKNIARIGD